MPGGVRWNPTEEPFSYWKLCCYYIPGLFVLLWSVALVAMMLGYQFQTLDRLLDKIEKWTPSSVPLQMGIGLATVIAYYLIFLKVFWQLLPASVRARIPYDRHEALQSKGDIRSLWDLRKLFLRTRT